jgi:hypothetical protein
MWWRRKKPEPCPESRKARENAEQALREAEEQWPRVHDATRSLRRMQRRNNFADAIEEIILRGRG